jgi:nicotinamidase-related amidase/GNAT superfamily N-acetyltransferase
MDALVIIDVQNGMFTTPGFTPHDGEATVARIAGLLDRARKNRTPVFFVQHDGGDGDPLGAGTPGFPFRAELAPAGNEDVTVKRHCNAFQETDLNTKLKRAGIDHLIVCGMQTEFCIDTAVRAAVERGYAVTLVSDGHTTFDTKTLSGAAVVAHHTAVLGGGFAKSVRADEIAFASSAGNAIDNDDCRIEFAEIDDSETRKALSDGLLAFNEGLLGNPEIRRFTWSLRSDGAARPVGGLIGRTSYRWLFVELLFVPESLRGRGLGEKLLAMAEAEAKKRGAIGAWLDTFNPDARKFYEKRGYRLSGEVRDNPPGHARYFLTKRF